MKRSVLFMMVFLSMFTSSVHAMPYAGAFRETLIEYFETLEDNEFSQKTKAQLHGRKDELIQDSESFLELFYQHLDELSLKLEKNPEEVVSFLDQSISEVLRLFYDKICLDEDAIQIPQVAFSSLNHFFNLRDQMVQLVLDSKYTEEGFNEFLDATLWTHYIENLNPIFKNVKKSPTASGPNLELTTSKGQATIRIASLNMYAKLVKKLVDCTRKRFVEELSQLNSNSELKKQLNLKMSFFMTKLILKYYAEISKIGLNDAEEEGVDFETQELVELYKQEFANAPKIEGVYTSAENGQFQLDDCVVLSETLVLKILEDVKQADFSEDDLAEYKSKFDAMESKIADLEVQLKSLQAGRNVEKQSYTDYFKWIFWSMLGYS